MGEIIEGLLELTKMTHAEVCHSRVDMSMMARDVFEELRDTARGRHVHIDIASGLNALGDQRLLRVALTNLIDNAIKFTSNRADARIQFGRVESEVESPFFIRDNGVGFDMAHADKLFRAFQRVHRQAEFDGAGIGLATVRRIIQRHNGKTWAEGATDRGATFYFTLAEKS
jgi:light-regulated signal transduction histidine kinase (bacteriophytochrome)